IDNELSLKLLAYHKKEKMIQILSKITGTNEELRFHVLPEDLIFNKTPWNIPESNEVLIYDKQLVFNDFHFSKNEQSIEITDKLPEVSKKHIAIDFKNFKLNEFLNYLNPEETLASGNLNGDFILE